ncbi:cytochrome P450 71AP13-like [Salvia miltiorrhiza]|uniref:cytochrome P450 71AP13-like n=1 Tax=Salvia miltiorrhiza TaxID=226208 RepID=UPI0025ABB58A|nr:cytochrome P450 71AP13-like [Salvia miltiorrhiza]
MEEKNQNPMNLFQQLMDEGYLLPILTALIFLSLSSLSLKLVSKSTTTTLPGPPKLPIIGNLHQLGKHPHLSLFSLARKYGPLFHLQLGEISTVVLSSAAAAKEAMKTHDLALATRPEIFAAKALFYNCTDIAFAPYGPHWRNVRKLCTLQLLSAKRVQSFAFVREEEASRLAARVSGSAAAVVDLSKLLNLYANDVLCRIVFGKDFSGGGGEYEKFGFKEMLDEYQELLGGFSMGDFFPSMEFLHKLTGHRARVDLAFQRFDKLFSDVIEERERMSCREGQNRDFVDILLELQKNGDGEIPLNMDNVKAILLDMFAAGTDTTFISLDWSMTELLTHPKILQKVQSEVRNVVGAKQLVSEAHLPHLHYMKALIKEVWRLHPPAPVLLPRESMAEIAINGHTIPAKTRVFINAWAVGRDPECWENPDEFEPERFLNSEIDFRGQDFELIPFGAGRRSCPAITFGAATVEMGLAQLLHSFDWELPPRVQPHHLDMTEVFGITMHRKSPLLVVAKPHFSEFHNSHT